MSMLGRLKAVDRRVIFLAIALAVMIPLKFPLHLPVKVGQSAEDCYKAIEALPEGSLVLVSFEYGPSTAPEVHPMSVAVLRQCFRKNLKVITMALWPEGLFMANAALRQVAEEEFHKEYGVDYVNLGFKAGNEVVIRSIGESFSTTYPVDSRGRPTSELPLMHGVENLANVDFIFSASAGFPGSVEWVQYAADPYHKPMSTGTTAVQVNDVMPYVRSRQVLGIIGGMSGAAEYEMLIERPDRATRFMDAQSIAHLVMVLFIVLGNLTFWLERRAKRAGKDT